MGLNTSSFGPTCLVTGGAGYLGRALVKALTGQGLRVRSIDRRPLDGPVAAHPQVEHVVADLRDRGAVRRAVEGCATVFHTAAVMSFLSVARARTREEVFGINVEGTRNVVEACREAGVARLVYTSTNTVCYDEEGVHLGDESRPYARAPVDLYAQSKIAAESLVLGADGQGGGGGLRTVAIRPAGIWGSGRGCYMIEKFVSELRAGHLVATVGDGKALADNTHVDNVVSAELLAAAALASAPAKVGGQAYFVTDEEPMPLMRWFLPLIEALGHALPKRSIPAWPIYQAARVSEWLHWLGGPKPFLTRLEVHNMTTTFTFRTDKARRELGYRPLVQHEAGMKDLVAFWKGTAA